MSRWRRVWLSLASAIAAELLIGIVLGIPGENHLVFERIFGFVLYASILVIPGWLVALPILVIPKSTDHRPKWLSLLLGTLIGPIIIFAVGIYAAIANGTGLNYKQEAWNLVFVAALVSFLTTSIYLMAYARFVSKQKSKTAIS
jgi:hypothetical protein